MTLWRSFAANVVDNLQLAGAILIPCLAVLCQYLAVRRCGVRHASCTFAAMAKWYGIRDARAQEHICAQAMQLPAKPYPSVEGIKTMMEIYDYREMRIHQPEDFYDASFVSELDKS